MRLPKSLMFLAACLTMAPCLYAGEIHVIVNKNVKLDSLTQADIRAIYLAKASSLPSGEELSPLDVQESNPLNELFYESVINKSIAQMNSYWSRMLFTGRGRPPKQLADTNEVIEMVGQSEKYIGYVDKAVSSAKVKVIYTVKLP